MEDDPDDPETEARWRQDDIDNGETIQSLSGSQDDQRLNVARAGKEVSSANQIAKKITIKQC